MKWISAVFISFVVASTGLQAWAMGNHSDIVRDQYGRALGGATITVYIAGTTDLAEVYSDNIFTLQTNPIVSDTLTGAFNFYAINGVYDLVIAHPQATFDANRTKRISVIDGSALTGGGTTAAGLEAAFEAVNEISGATSAKPLIIGNGTQKVNCYGDPTRGTICEPDPPGDSAWRCWTNFNCVIRDEESAAAVLTIDPDAATRNAMYQFGTNYKPLVSIPVSLYPRGLSAYTENSIVTNQPKGGYIQVTDVDTDAVDFRFVATGKMVGMTTATIRLYGVSRNASPSGNIQFNCAMRSNRPGTDTYVAHSTTGEQAITLTPATQNRPVSAVTPAITINGTVAEFAEIEGSCEVNATNTTSAQMTDFFLRADAVIQLNANSWSD